MLRLARWLSETPLSAALRALDGVVPLLQTLHILAIAMVLPSTLMIGLRVFAVARAAAPEDAVRRFAAWIWSGLALLAFSGAALVLIEPQRTLPNGSFQIKLVLLALAVAATFALCRSLRGGGSVEAGSKVFAAGSLALWCAVAVAGRFIAYRQPD